MRSRRISILLAILAISAVTLFVISLLDSQAMAAPVVDKPAASVVEKSPAAKRAPAVADTLQSFEETITIGSDGSAWIEIQIVIEKGGSRDLLMPFDFDGGQNFSILSGPVVFNTDESGAVAETIQILGRRLLNLQVQQFATSGDTIRVGSEVPNWFDQENNQLPYGEFGLHGSYTNFSSFVLRNFRLNLVLPPGMVVHSIEKVVPQYNQRKNPKPPYQIAKIDGRTYASISAANLSPADKVQLEINIRPSKRSRIPLIGGLLAAICYLIFFRDVLKPGKPD